MLLKNNKCTVYSYNIAQFILLGCEHLSYRDKEGVKINC